MPQTLSPRPIAPDAEVELVVVTRKPERVGHCLERIRAPVAIRVAHAREFGALRDHDGVGTLGAQPKRLVQAGGETRPIRRARLP